LLKLLLGGLARISLDQGGSAHHRGGGQQSDGQDGNTAAHHQLVSDLSQAGPGRQPRDQVVSASETRPEQYPETGKAGPGGDSDDGPMPRSGLAIVFLGGRLRPSRWCQQDNLGQGPQ
jgi:hypothetical protein